MAQTRVLAVQVTEKTIDDISECPTLQKYFEMLGYTYKSSDWKIYWKLKGGTSSRAWYTGLLKL
jgi:hypothetical protein